MLRVRKHPVFSSWIKAQDKSIRDEIGHAIQAVCTHAKQTPRTILYPLTGKPNEGLWEIKAKVLTSNYRVICAFTEGVRLELLSGDIKNDDNFYRMHAGSIAQKRLSYVRKMEEL